MGGPAAPRPAGRERGGGTGRGPVHGAAPHRAAAGHPRQPVGRHHRLRPGGQRLRHAGHHRRPPPEGRLDAGLRRVSQHPELAVGRGGGCAAAGRAGRDRGRRQPPGRAPLRTGVRMSRNGPIALIYHTLFVIFMLAPILVVCFVAFTPEGYLSFPTDGWSLRWFYAIGRYPEFVSAFWRSLWLGALSSAIAVAFSGPGAPPLGPPAFAGRDAMTALFMSPL